MAVTEASRINFIISEEVGTESGPDVPMPFVYVSYVRVGAILLDPAQHGHLFHMFREQCWKVNGYNWLRQDLRRWGIESVR